MTNEVAWGGGRSAPGILEALLSEKVPQLNSILLPSWFPCQPAWIAGYFCRGRSLAPKPAGSGFRAPESRRPEAQAPRSSSFVGKACGWGVGW